MPLPPPPLPAARDLDDLDDLLAVDEPLIWTPPGYGLNNGALPLSIDAGASFLQFTRPDFFASHREALPVTNPRSSQPAQEPTDEPANHHESPAQLEHALLFSEPTVTATLLDESRRPVQFAMTAEMGGMFFVAEDIFSDEQTGRPELTCYRRNLWQCLGDVTFSREPRHLIDEQGSELPISRLTAAIVAKESISGNPTEIVSTSWKTTDAATGNALWVMGSPPACPLSFPDNPAFREPGVSGCISLKMAWNRLQFKHSTANNGRRKGPQQHYIVQIHLLAESDMGRTVKVADIKSSPVIVRGRSPRNFESQKEVPIPRVQKPEKRLATDAATPLGEPITGQCTAPSAPNPSRLPGPNHPRRQPSDSTSWPPRKRVAAYPETPTSSQHLFVRSPESTANILAPSNAESTSEILTLSLFDDEPDATDPGRVSPVPSGRSPPASSTDLDQNDNMYYEYFPLGADDWMSSVEAVYCPHVNHYANRHGDPREMQEQGRARRYFTTKQ